MTDTTQRAVLAGGCFWGMQDLIRRQPGVVSTRVGYTGGQNANATYRNHPGHAEAIEILFDPAQTSYRDILEFFFQIHDPTTRNRQGNDVGTSLPVGDLLRRRRAEAGRRGHHRRRRGVGTVAGQGGHGGDAGRPVLGGRARAPGLPAALPLRLHLPLPAAGLEAAPSGLHSVIPVIPESAADRDYPQMAAERGRVEPAPRRVRGYVDGVLVFDTIAARYVWEVPYYPQYYVPLKDVRTQYLVDEDHAQRLQFGTSRSHALHVNGVTIAEAVRVFGDDALPASPTPGVSPGTRVEWFEEDERIVGGHPRNPYVARRRAALAPALRVELDGAALADTHRPVLLFETGLPTRYYIDRTDVTFEHLIAYRHPDGLPLQGRDVGLLVRAHRRRGRRRPGVDLQYPAGGRGRSRAWSPSSTSRSTSSSTAPICRGRARTSSRVAAGGSVRRSRIGSVLVSAAAW